MNKDKSHSGIESQNKAIIKFMLKGGKTTQLEAYKRFKCVNLSGRISEIAENYSISKEWIKVGAKRVVRYGISF